jgi:DNA-binding winged helix-turn-helix (wHTH) protein/tetratricopeptide (TPR) repeat protein
MGKRRQSSGHVELDLGRYELRRSGVRIKLEKKPMELLIFLVARRDQLVSRDEIVKKLWRSSLFIDTERNVNNILRKIRTALGDNTASPRFIETVVGKGYRFVGPIRVVDARFGRSDPGTGSHTAGLDSAWGQRTSLAVLPLLLLGKAREDHGVCLGFADALVALLGNVENLDVLPMSSVLSLPLEVPVSDVASRLGIRFVIHGAIRTLKGHWHLSVELFDTLSQAPRWTRQCEVDLDRLFELETEVAKQIAGVLNRPLAPVTAARRPRHSKDALAYAEFMRGYQLSTSGDPEVAEKAIHHLTSAVTRDPTFALAHATLSFACARRHFEADPANTWLERAEFHGQRALDLEPDLPEGHVARALLLWGPSKNFQHLEAIAALKCALRLQNNLPHAYNRLGTIMAHIGLLDHAREMYERGRPFHPQKAISHSVAQVYLWSQQYELALEEVEAWRKESPANTYAIYFGPQPHMMMGDWKAARAMLNEALQLLPDEPLIISLQGLLYALTGKIEQGLDCVTKACASPKSFGHAHHVYYQIACILALAGQRKPAFEWLERSVSTGFACWPFFAKDRCLENLRELSEFGLLLSSLQNKYPDHLGLF